MVVAAKRASDPPSMMQPRFHGLSQQHVGEERQRKEWPIEVRQVPETQRVSER
jgi:hypothetical protein